MTPWMYLAIAVFFNVFGASFLKLSEGLTRLWPTVCMFAFYIVAFIGLTLSVRDLDVSIAYAVWSGIGIALITVVDVFIFKTHLSLLKLFSIGLILLGVLMLKLLTE